MRLIFVLLIGICSVTAKAQTFMPMNYIDYSQRQFLNSKALHDSASDKKWFLTHYVGLNAGFSFFKGGNATVVSAPIGLQLTRKLNDNLYAFAGVSVAPAYVNFNNAFLSSNIKGFQTNNFLKTNSFNMYSRAELGLMYVNDAKTFSISGSIGIERNNFPVYPYDQSNTGKRVYLVPNR